MNFTLSQQHISENIPILGISREKKFKSAKFPCEMVDYRFRLTKTERIIFDYITSFKKKDFIKLRRKTIATFCDCSIKTVTRSLAKFHADGVIFKERPFHQSPNILKLTPELVRGSQAFQLWVNKLDNSNIDMVVNHGAYRNLKGEIVPLFKQNVPTYTKRYLKRVYITTTTTPPKITYNRKKREGGRGNVSMRKISSGLIIRGGGVGKKEERVEMLNEAARNFIIRSQKNPNAREALENPTIRSALQSSLSLEIQHSLKWEDREALFLAAIPDEAVAHTYGIAKRMIEGILPITAPIDDSFNWFVAVSAKKCKELGLQIDRPFYSALCTIMGVAPVVAGENPKPLRKSQKSRQPAGHSPMKEAPKMTENERIGFLVKEIASFKEKIANPQKYFLPNVNIEEALKFGRSLLAAREKELEELIAPPTPAITKSECDMTPEEWLVWNRNRKIERLKKEKESYGTSTEKVHHSPQADSLEKGRHFGSEIL